jgi:serine/threonine-protein kinase
VEYRELPVSLAAGTTLGPYVIDAPLGAGGMGEVYRARDLRLGRTVAIKVLPAPFAEDPDRIRRFEQEARAVAALNHPHICQIYDVGRLQPETASAARAGFLVLEYVDGTPLRGPLAADDTLRLALQIASALEAAHRHGILHRDLKPANILVTRRADPLSNRPTVKLLDFGLATAARGSDADATRTVEGTITGTPAYMSPEQAQGRTVDARSDVFSLGAVLYELLSGHRAFEGDSSVEVLSAVLREDPRPLGASPLASVVKRCLEKDASRRYQTMGELRAALEDISRSTADPEPSIAVLPFANLSADKENEYFSDGLAEEIINALTRIPGLKVTARTSAFAFRGKEQDIRRIAETLDVRTVLEGSVRRAGSRIRVSAQLISAADGYHLWSDRFDRELADVFVVQDEIASAIATALQVKLAPRTAARVRYTPSLPGYEAYLRAGHESRKLTPEGLARAREWYEEAITRDPHFALAHTMFGFHFAQLANYGLLRADEAMPLVRDEARKALEADPSLPDGHAMLGLVAAMYDYDWDEAARCFDLALACDPVPSRVRRYYALYYLLPIGRVDEAVDECARALREDPLDLLGRVRFAQCLEAAGRFDEASSELRRVLELDENLWFTHFILGLDQLRGGQRADAMSSAEKACAIAPWSPSAKGLLAAVSRLSGDARRSDALLEKLRSGPAYGRPLALATYHLCCAEIDAAADCTERAIAERHPALFFFLRAHGHELLRSSRWPALAKMLKLALDGSRRS